MANKIQHNAVANYEAFSCDSFLLKVEYNSRRSIVAFVNGEKIEFDEQRRLDFRDVFVIKHNETEVGIYFSSGVSVETKSIDQFLTYQISIPTRFKGNYKIFVKFESIKIF